MNSAQMSKRGNNNPSSRARSTFLNGSSIAGASSKFGNQTVSTLSPIKHKHLRQKSPIEKTLPKNFSVNRNVAYLFESDQAKYGAYKSPQKRKDAE